ncbi:MAG: septum site-determining protein MinC [Aeromonas sp.]
MAVLDNDLKGSSFTIPVLQLSNSNTTLICQLLSDKVAQAPAFFDAAPLVVNVSALEEIPDFTALAAAIAQTGFVLVGIAGVRSSAMKAAAKAAHLAVLASGRTLATPSAEVRAAPELHAEPAPSEASVTPPAISSTKIHVGPVRSGQQVRAPSCSLVVLGAVSAGAEVMADGNIHVYGALRGKALAGGLTNTSARIFCQQMQAELLAIAGTYLSDDPLANAHITQPVHIYLNDGSLCIERIK